MPSPVPATVEKFVPRTPVVDFTIPLDTSNLEGKSVLITGGASGIGLACATTIAAAGALVTIVDVQEETGSAVAKDLLSKGHQVQFVPTDVTSYESQTAAFKAAVQFGHGKLDIVVANAGVLAERNLFDVVAEMEPSLDSAPPQPALSCIEVNLKGVYFSCYLALYYFRLPRPAEAAPFKKAIVLIGSAAGYQGYANSDPYSMSKFGVRGLFYGMRAKASEQTPVVRINLVAPWYIKTPMVTDPKRPDAEVIGQSTSAFGFAPIDAVVDAVVRLSVREDITGRAALITPERNLDLEDDIWGGYGGLVVQQQVGAIFDRVIKTMSELQEAQPKVL